MSPEHGSEDERQRLRQRATDELAGATTEGAKRQVSPKVMIRVGDPSDRILAVASRVRAELIVLGSTRASKSSRMLAAGVVHRVVAEARAPVIVVRQEQGVSKNHIELLTA
jgi:nucleotide-binding universal stress UspA family protein